MEWLNELNVDGRVMYFLCLVEAIVDKIQESDVYELTQTAIEKTWEWIFKKDIPADDLYYFLENIEENDILSYLQVEENKEKESVLMCIADALAYIAYEAYMYEKAEYLPETIEAVDDTTVKEFLDSFTKVYNQENIIEDLKGILKENFFVGANSDIDKEKIVDSIHEKLKEYHEG